MLYMKLYQKRGIITFSLGAQVYSLLTHKLSNHEKDNVTRKHSRSFDLHAYNKDLSVAYSIFEHVVTELEQFMSCLYKIWLLAAMTVHLGYFMSDLIELKMVEIPVNEITWDVKGM